MKTPSRLAGGLAVVADVTIWSRFRAVRSGSHLMRRPLVVALTAAAAVCAAPAVVASAQPGTGPLIETTCSYAQLEAALRVQAPEASNRLQRRPAAQRKIQELLALPVEQRRERVDTFLSRNPDVAAWIEQTRASPEGQQRRATAQRVNDTCHDY